MDATCVFNEAIKAFNRWLKETFHDFIRGGIISAWKNFNYEAFLLRHNRIAYLIDTNIVDFLQDFMEFCICPWYNPWGSFKQVVYPFAVFFWAILAKSPVFCFIFTVGTIYWIYDDYYKYIEMGGGGTVGGWLRTKFLVLVLILIRVASCRRPSWTRRRGRTWGDSSTWTADRATAPR